MRKLILLPAAFLAASATTPPAAPARSPSLAELLRANWCGDPLALEEGPAQILPGYGDGGFAIRTGVPQAQAFFNNGMQLAHAYAHGAAVKAFEEAVRRDPDCAMCLWGLAWASGPTINFGIDEYINPRLRMAMSPRHTRRMLGVRLRPQLGFTPVVRQRSAGVAVSPPGVGEAL